MICSRCVYDDRVPGITFDAEGVCNYCHQHDAMTVRYPTGAEGARRLAAIVERIKAAGRGKPYDCVVGVSGGCDSSWLLVKMVEAGLRPLAVHFDNTWDSTTAQGNIQAVIESLGVDLFTYVVDNREYDDIYRSFLRSGVKDIEAPTDIGLATTLYRAAEANGVKYIIEGHSFRTEGIAPLDWIYMDGRYIAYIHKRFGTVPMRTFPNLDLASFLRWSVVRGIKRIRPLYFMDYDKAAVKLELASKYGWTWYGGHHLENWFTAFWHTYFLPRRYGIDARMLGHAALVRSGQMDRSVALGELAVLPECDPELLLLVKKRLRLSDEDLDALMALPRHDYREFPTYKRTFEHLRPLFWLLYRLDRVPFSFYMKFAVPAR